MGIKTLQEMYALEKLTNPRYKGERKEARHLLEEVGELLLAIGRRNSVWSTRGQRVADAGIAEELADVVISAVVVANTYKIDLTEAIIQKTRINIRTGQLIRIRTGTTARK